MKSINRYKKGFTLVELILVVAIIAALTAITVPIIVSDNSGSEANAKAKAFYYSLQSTMTDYRLDYDMDSLNSSGYVIIPPAGKYYLVMETAGKYVSSTNLSHIVSYNLYTDSGFSAVHVGSGTGNTMGTVLFDRLRRSVEEVDKDGYFYASIDSFYRVEAVYWSAEPLNAGDRFDSNNRVDGVSTGAYPENLANEGQIVFA